LPHSVRIYFTSDYFEDNHSDESAHNSDHKEQNTTLLSTLQSLVTDHQRYPLRFRMYLQNKETKN
jgi:hypothetical protein